MQGTDEDDDGEMPWWGCLGLTTVAISFFVLVGFMIYVVNRCP